MGLIPEYDQRHFSGKETDAAGKVHNVLRVTCLKCGYTITDMHYACCGHAACGKYTMEPHKCKKGNK